MISSITRLRIFGLSLLLAVTMLPATVFAQTRPSIAALEARIATLEDAPVQGLNGYVTMDLSTPSRPTVRVSGANLQVVNGLNATATVNGLGNLIVGYDEINTFLPAVCSLGQFTDQISCESAGRTWAVAHKTGSHNLVLGYGHRYSRYGGLLAGYSNTVNGTFASVSGGAANTASGTYSSVSGGTTSTASGSDSSVSGGYSNTASGVYASVSGGSTRSAIGAYDWVAGTLFETQ